MSMICPICKENDEKSKVKFIEHLEEKQLWDYDEEGKIIERKITVKIECEKGHQTYANLRGVLDKAEQV